MTPDDIPSHWRINQRYGWKMAMSDKALVDAIKIKWNITQKKTEVA